MTFTPHEYQQNHHKDGTEGTLVQKDTKIKKW